MEKFLRITAWCSVVAWHVHATTISSAVDTSGIRFVEVTEKAGLVEPLAGMMGHGAAWGDFDRDGQPDLFVGGFCDRPSAEYAPASGPVASQLFRNRGDGKFESVADTPARHFGRTSGALFADLDDDDWPELYVSNNARAKSKGTQEPQSSATRQHSLLLANDHGKLVDRSSASGACPDALLSARNVGVLDFDRDGKLDLLVVEDRFVPKPRTTLFRNLGNMRFEDANQAANFPDDVFGLGLAISDVNFDGFADVFVPHSNRLFLGTSDGKFREDTHAAATFAWKPLDKEDWPCGACFADLTGDGRPELILAIHHQQARNRVFLHEGVVDGSPHFRDVTREVGLEASIPARCPHVEAQDFDNDGLVDLYFSAAWLDDDGTVTPLLYHNEGLRNGLPRFTPPRKVEGEMVYFPAGPTADFDRDGRLDLFLVNWFANNRCRLLKNESPERHWLDVTVAGKSANRMGIGAVVSVFEAGKLGEPQSLLGSREMTIGFGYASGQMPILHFGLGEHTKVDVRAKLPDGSIVERKSVAANQTLALTEE